MKKHKKRKSIFKVILKKVFITVIVLNFILTGMIMRETIMMLDETMEAKKDGLKKDVKGLVSYMEKTTASIENMFYIIQLQLIKNLNKVAETKNLSQIDLNKQLIDLGLDTGYHEINIIKNGVVVNSTKGKGIGTNLKEYGEEAIDYLDRITETGEFVQERFDLDPETKRFKSWSFQATEDKKYIIELGSFSEISDDMLVMFQERLKNIVEDNVEVVDANVWIPHDDWSLLDDPSPAEHHDSLMSRALNKKADVHMDLSKHGYQSIDYMYLELERNQMDKKSIIVSLQTDMNYHREKVRTTIKKQFFFTLLVLFILLIIIAITTRDYRIMLRDLISKTSVIAEGNFHERALVKGNNEFTTLAEQFNLMVDKLEQTYNEINQKNKLINESNEELKQQNEEIITQHDEIEAQRNFAVEQKSIIEKQKEEMVDSINYAQRIQEAALPHEYYVNEILPENFIIFQPRDIVSGDFYWIKQVNEYIVVAAADCTGHGVPGAIMSILGISLLNEIVNHKQIVQPDLILNELRKQVKRSLRQSGKAREARDGMDIALCSINTKTNMLQYAGAFNPLLILRNNELLEFKADRMPVGIYIKEKPGFTLHETKLEPGDTMYIFSDGFADQTGGEKGKKFKTANLKQLIIDNHEFSMVEQKDIFENTLKSWMKGHEQIDDILLIGFRVS